MYQWCAEKWRVVLRAMISGGSPPIVECLRVEESTVRSGAPVRWDFLSPQNARENRTQDASVVSHPSGALDTLIRWVPDFQRFQRPQCASVTPAGVD